MPVSPVFVTPRYQAVQFDGTNAQDIADWLERPLLSNSGGFCSIDWMTYIQSIDLGPGDWVIASTTTPPQYLSTCLAGQYDGQYVEYTPPA